MLRHLLERPLPTFVTFFLALHLTFMEYKPDKV